MFTKTRIESFIYSIILTFKKGESNALSSLKKLIYYYLENLRFITTVPDKITTPANTSTRLVASPVNGRVGPSSVVVERLGSGVVVGRPGSSAVVVVVSSEGASVVVVVLSLLPPPLPCGL